MFFWMKNIYYIATYKWGTAMHSHAQFAALNRYDINDSTYWYLKNMMPELLNSPVISLLAC